MKISLNQKLISLVEYYNLIDANFLISNKPIKRTMNNNKNFFAGTKLEKLLK